MSQHHDHQHDHQHGPMQLARPRMHVAGEHIRAKGPLMLPSHVCVECGSRERGGVIRNDKVTYVSPWLWLTLFISWVITWIAYLATRKQIEVQYYLCPKCADKRKIRTTTSGIVTVVSMAGMVGGTAIFGWSILAPFTGAFITASLAWLIFSSPPLRAIVHDDGWFSLKGASRGLLDTVDRKRLPGG